MSGLANWSRSTVPMLRVLGPGSLLRPNSLSQAAAPVWLSSWGDDQNARETSPVGVARGSSFIEFPEKKASLALSMI